MAFIRKRRLYESLPLWIQNTVHAVPFGWLAGRDYRRALARGPRFDRADREEILAYQERALGELLSFAVDQVPAYRGLCGIVERLPPREALKAFPLLVKEDLQDRLQDHLPRSFQQIPHYEITTGGTSGNQLRVFVDDSSQAVEHAFVHRLWGRVGYTPRHRKATFRGVPFPHLRPGVYWQHNPINSELQFSPFHMSDKTLPAYIEALIDFNAAYLHGYPSAIDYLAQYVRREGLRDRLPRIRAAFLVSEGCSREQRASIEDGLGTRVFSFYGHSERSVMAGECERNETYHNFPDYGVVELVTEEGAACEEGARGEIVGTGLINRSMPLIRYRTGDSALRCSPRCECGRSWDRFTDVAGRWKQEMIVGRNGARISLAALNMHGPVFEGVTRFQYFQDRPGACSLRVMVAPEFSEEDRRRLEGAYAAKVSDELDFRVEVVDEIPLTARGKLQMLVSTLREEPSATLQAQDA